MQIKKKGEKMIRLLTGREGGVCFAQCSGNWECTSGESFGEAGDLGRTHSQGSASAL